MSQSRKLLLLFAGLACLSPLASGQADDANSPVIETGKFRLYAMERLAGEENYQIIQQNGSLVLRSKFEFSDRGTKVPLTTTLRVRQDLTPEQFEIKGLTSFLATKIDTAVEISGITARVRHGVRSEETAVPKRFFTISGALPASVQLMLFRYWTRHGRPAKLRLLPSGEVTIQHRGHDTIQINGKRQRLERYSLDGIIWGREWLWVNSVNELVALITMDGGLNNFQALREGYDSALSALVSRAAEEGISDLNRTVAPLSPKGSQPLAILGGTLIDGTGSAAVNDSAVIVQGSRIVAAGARTQVKIPEGAFVVHAEGKFVLPGLWDMHAHLVQVEWAPLYLAAGVTTARDLGNEFELITALRDSIQSGRGAGPQLLLAGLVDGAGPEAYGVIQASTPEEALAVVRRYKSAGFQQIKIYSVVKPELVPVITSEAHRLGMSVTGHVPEGMNAFQAVEAGMDQINHIAFIAPVMLPAGAKQSPDDPPMEVPWMREELLFTQIDLHSPEAKAAITYFRDHGTVIDPTLAIFEWSEHPKEIPVSSFEPGIESAPPELAEALESSGLAPPFGERFRAVLAKEIEIVGALHRAGVPIVAGTDDTVPGYSLYRELELYVQAGFTPMEAIQSATIVPARVMNLDKEVGTIEPGKRADIIIVDGNPIENISNIRKVKTVIANGRGYDCTELWRGVGFKQIPPKTNVVESGKFRVFAFHKAQAEENYQIVSDDESLTLTTRSVWLHDPLPGSESSTQTITLKMNPDLTPNLLSVTLASSPSLRLSLRLRSRARTPLLPRAALPVMLQFPTELSRSSGQTVPPYK